MKKKILAFSVGRSDYDRYYPILNEINNNKKLDLKLLLSSVHFLKYFGETYKFIDKKFDCFPRLKKIKIKNLPDIVNKDSKIIISQINKFKPDVILVLGDRFEMLPDATSLKDAKTKLQEWLQARGLGLPEYNVSSMEGPPHKRTFIIQCSVGEDAVMGHGLSRRNAEQDAAKHMLSALTHVN